MTPAELNRLLSQPAGRSVVPNGYFTLELPDGSHRTFRIHSKKLTAKFAPGERILSLLIGPANTTDYEGFAFVEDSGFVVWKRFVNARQARHADALWRLLTGETVEGYAVEVSKRCLVCNRTLTTPESLAEGIGPNCKARMGL